MDRSRKKIYFTWEESRTKFGAHVFSRRLFLVIPPCTHGRVVLSSRRGGGYQVAVEWRVTRLRDWFSRDEYERYLEEV